MIAKAIRTNFRRRRNARRFGIPFTRSATFRVPAEIKVQRRRIPLQLPSDDCAAEKIFQEIFLDNSYRLERLPIVPRTILDVGAHLGFTSIALSSCFPGATIHGYEPDPLNYQYLEKNASAQKIITHNQAIGARFGSAAIKRKMFRGMRAGNATKVIFDAEGEVEVVPLSEAVSRIGGGVDLVKIDCDGSEWSILEPADALAQVKYLIMEITEDVDQGKDLKSFLALLSSRNFIIEGTRPFGRKCIFINARNAAFD